jgi:glycerol dehydrogenase-like iron-containing ADH family enzyme
MPLVPPIDPEIVVVDGGHQATQIQFTYPNHAEISQIGLTIGIASGQIAKLLKVLAQSKAASSISLPTMVSTSSLEFTWDAAAESTAS